MKSKDEAYQETIDHLLAEVKRLEDRQAALLQTVWRVYHEAEHAHALNEQLIDLLTLFPREGDEA